MLGGGRSRQFLYQSALFAADPSLCFAAESKTHTNVRIYRGKVFPSDIAASWAHANDYDPVMFHLSIVAGQGVILQRCRFIFCRGSGNACDHERWRDFYFERECAFLETHEPREVVYNQSLHKF